MRTNTPSVDPPAAAMTILGPDDVDRLAWRPVVGCPGVRAVEIWRSGGEVDALIAYDAGAATPGRPHPGADHHIWVVAGSASIAGRRVVAGSYVHVPPAFAHPIDEVGPGGCTLLQIHRRLPSAQA
jgi:hypothetical protein